MYNTANQVRLVMTAYCSLADAHNIRSTINSLNCACQHITAGLHSCVVCMTRAGMYGTSKQVKKICSNMTRINDTSQLTKFS